MAVWMHWKRWCREHQQALPRFLCCLPEHLATDQVSWLRSTGVEVVRSPSGARGRSADSILALAVKYGLVSKRCIMSALMVGWQGANYQPFLLPPPMPTVHKVLDDMCRNISGTESTPLRVLFTVDGGLLWAAMAAWLRQTLRPLQITCVVNQDAVVSVPVMQLSASDPMTHVMSTQSLSRVESMFCPVCPVSTANSGSPFVDQWVRVTDIDAFDMSLYLIRDQGILVSSSGGACVAAAKFLMQDSSPSEWICLCTDHALLYPNTLVNDDYLALHSLCSHLRDPLTPAGQTPVMQSTLLWTVSDLDLSPVTAVQVSNSLASALEVMAEREFDSLPVLDKQRRVKGFVTSSHLQCLLEENHAKPSDPVSRYMYTWKRTLQSPSSSVVVKSAYIPITMETSLQDLMRFFDKHSVAFVTDEAAKWVLGVCTKYDLLRFLDKVQPHAQLQ